MDTFYKDCRSVLSLLLHRLAVYLGSTTMPGFLQIIESIQRLRPPKWYYDIHHFSESREIPSEEANCFIKCVENGGSGQKADGTWRSNPSPYDSRINLTSHSENMLNFLYKDTGDRSATSVSFVAPSASILDQSSRHVFARNISNKNKSITIKVQREIVKYIIGTHHAMTQFYPEWAEFRRKSCAPLDVDNNNSINVSPPIYKVMMIFDLGSIKELWRVGDYDEVGQQEIALLDRTKVGTGALPRL